MNSSNRVVMVVCLVTALASAASAQFATRETSAEVDGIPQDSEHKDTLTEAVAAIREGRTDYAIERLNEIRTYCDAEMASPEKRVVAVSSLGEFVLYTRSVEGEGPVVWMDMVCPSAYQMLAFVHASSQEFDAALQHLETAAKLAPYWAQPLIERGYILNQLRRFPEALENYEKALELARSFESSRDMQPTALRGAGFALIELGRLAAARDAFKESLTLEPGNSIALGELRYIDQLEAAQN